MTHLLFLFPLFFIVAAQSTYFPNCPSYQCGDVNITYPFWKMDESTTHLCGYPDLGIRCTNNKEPIFTLGDHPYHVRLIESSSIIIVDTDVSSVPPGPNECPTVRHNISLGTLPLEFPMSTVNLTFRFNCTGFPSFAIEIPCLEGNAYVNVMNNSTEESEWDEYTCQEEVVTRVFRTTGSVNLWNEFVDLLLRGFRLQWRKTDDCEKCEKSDGLCGHRGTTEFICFCPDGTISNDYCKGSGRNLTLKLGIGIGSALLSIVIMFIIFIIWKLPSTNCVASLKHKTKEDKNIEAFVIHYGSLSTKRYNYSDIKKMTNSFKVKLGQGGFGQVFKGKLPDGRPVAVKVLNSSKANGQDFINEVASIGRTSHVNIVTLLGYCYDHKRKALVYEYMPNGSLEKFIHGHTPMKTTENIRVNKLYEIALGIAYGLDYLHRGCNTRILHLDIKPHNILLDEDFCPKIADFGLAKLYSRKESVVSMLEARGTIGYIAPEVYNRNFGVVSHKCDVYSYGMLLLKMVGGRKNVDAGVGSERMSEIYFPDWIYNRLHKNEFLLDNITTTEENDYARKMTIVGLWCIQTAPNQRPSIDKVIEMLEGSMEAMEVPPKPFFSSPPQSPMIISSTYESMIT